MLQLLCTDYRSEVLLLIYSSYTDVFFFLICLTISLVIHIFLFVLVLLFFIGTLLLMLLLSNVLNSFQLENVSFPSNFCFQSMFKLSLILSILAFFQSGISCKFSTTQVLKFNSTNTRTWSLLPSLPTHCILSPMLGSDEINKSKILFSLVGKLTC